MIYSRVRNLLKDLRTRDEEFWIHTGQTQALTVFHKAAEQVPAYKDFLSKHGIKNHAKIRVFEDFVNNVPVSDKENYIYMYSLQDRVCQSKDCGGGVIYTSSGTTGKATLWQRNEVHERNIINTHEFLIQKYFRVEQYKTLFIDCFAMGIHVAGYLTATSINSLIKKYPNIFLATPGSKKEDILALLEQVQGQYEQIVLIGYPPFIKDIVEISIEEGFDWGKVRSGFLFSAQGVSEHWRAYLKKLVQGDVNTPIIGIYGSADAGAMAFETPLSILMREKSEFNKTNFNFKLKEFGGQTPFLFQFIPTLHYFESLDNELVVTCDSGVPLIRYNVHDIGKVVEFDTLHAMDRLSHYPKLPFLSLYARSNFTVVFYGANIYPEHIHSVLQQKYFLHILTGKFILETKEDKKFRQTLHIHLELNHSSPKIAEKKLYQKITNDLGKINREFKVVFKEMEKHDSVLIHVYKKGDVLFQSKKMKFSYVRNKK